MRWLKLSGSQVLGPVPAEINLSHASSRGHEISAWASIRAPFPAPEMQRPLRRALAHDRQPRQLLRGLLAPRRGLHQGRARHEGVRAREAQGPVLRRDHRDGPGPGPRVADRPDQDLVPAAVAGHVQQLPEGHGDGRRRRDARHGVVHRPGGLGSAGGRPRARPVAVAGRRRRARAARGGDRRRDGGVRQGEEAEGGEAVARVLRHGDAAGNQVAAHKARLLRHRDSAGHQLAGAHRV
jgi:hypothetical protein